MKKLLSKQTKTQNNQALLNHSSDLANLTDKSAENLSGGNVIFLLITNQNSGSTGLAGKLGIGG